MTGTTRKPAKAVAPAADEAPKQRREPTSRRVETTPAQRQFPSLDGEPEVEVAERSPDVEEPTASEHVKVFVVQANPAGEDFDEAMHGRNITAMRQQAILLGLRPTGDGRFVGSESIDAGQSVRLTYSLPVVPAVVDEPDATRYVSEADQHAFDEKAAEAQGDDAELPAEPLEDRGTDTGDGPGPDGTGDADAVGDPDDNSTPEGSGAQA